MRASSFCSDRLFSKVIQFEIVDMSSLCPANVRCSPCNVYVKMLVIGGVKPLDTGRDQ